MIVVDVTYALYCVTFATGMLFFVRFDARRRPLRRRLIGVHLVMAVVTFIMITSILAVGGWSSSLPAPPKNPKYSTMWDYDRQHRAEYQAHNHSALP